MGCTSEKSIPTMALNKRQTLLIDENIIFDLHDIEKQGESKHPQKEINEEIEEKNYYNYNLNDLVLVNKSKMTVKRIENFEDDDSDDNDGSDDNNNQLKNIEEENNEEEELNEDNKNNIVNNEHEIVQNDKENKINIINKLDDEGDKKPEDKKPPNIEKLRKKGKEKQQITLILILFSIKNNFRQ